LPRFRFPSITQEDVKWKIWGGGGVDVEEEEELKWRRRS
jgi:hypothetical protein